MPDSANANERMTDLDKKRSAAALAETQHREAEERANREPDPNEPTGPHLKTGYGLTAG